MSIFDELGFGFGDTPEKKTGSVFDELGFGFGEDEDELSIQEEIKRQREELYADALPALGKVEEEKPRTAGIFNVLAKTTPAGWLGEGLEETGLLPQGATAHYMDRAADTAAGWVYGLAEEAGMLPEGTRQEMGKKLEEDFITIAENAQNPGLLATGELVSTLGGGMAGGAGSSILLKQVPKAMVVAGNMAEALLQAYGDTAGLEGAERTKGMLLAGGMGALGGRMAANGTENAKLAKIAADNAAKAKAAAEAAAKVEAASAGLDPTPYTALINEVDTYKNAIIQEGLAKDAQRGAEVLLRKDDTLLKQQMMEQADEQARVGQMAYNALMSGPGSAENAADNMFSTAKVNKDGTIEVQERPVTDTLYDLLTAKETPLAPPTEPVGPGAPLFIGSTKTKQFTPVVDDAIANNATVPTPMKGMVWMEDWMKSGVAEVVAVGKTAFKKALAIADDIEEGIFASRKAQGLPEVLDGETLVRMMREGDVVDPKIISNKDATTESPMLLTFKDKNGKQHAARVHELPDPEDRGAWAVLQRQHPTFKRDEIPSLREAMQIVDGGIEKASEVLDSIVSSKNITAMLEEARMEVDAIFMGDFGRINNMSPQQRLLAAAETRSRVQQARAEVSSLKEVLSNSVPEAVSPAQAVSEVARLREQARQMALKLGDPRIFDEADYWYRRNKYGNSGLRPDQAEGATTSRTVTDAYSEYRDAMVAIQEKVAARAKKVYARLTKNNRVQMSQQDFVAQQVKMATDKLNEVSAQAQTIHQGKSDTAIIAALDREVGKQLNKYKIDPDSIGFRGDTEWAIQQGINGAAEWLGKKTNNTSLKSLDSSRLMEIAAQAHTERAPIEVFDAISRELQARKAKVAGPAPELADMSTEQLSALADDAFKKVSTDVRSEMLGAQTVPEPRTPWEKASRWFAVKARTLVSADREIRAGLRSGVSTEDAVQALADPVQRQNLRGELPEVLKSRSSAYAEYTHSMAVAQRDLDEAALKFIKASEEKGVKVTRSQVMQDIKQMHENGAMDQIADEGLRTTVKRVDEILTRAIDEIIKEGVITDQELLGKIKQNRNAYLYRSYSIFKEPGALLAPIKKTKPYQRLFKAIKDQRYDEIFASVEESFRPKLQAANLSEREIQAALNITVHRRIEAHIEHLVKGKLKVGENPALTSSILPVAKQDYFISRVLDDPNVRAIMGEEQHFDVAARVTMERLASDIAAFRVQRGMKDAFMKAGMISTEKVGQNWVPLNSKNMKQLAAGDEGVGVLYAHPSVARIFEAVHNPQVRSWMDAITAFVKTAQVATWGGFMANVIGMPMQAFLSKGLGHTLGDVLKTPYDIVKGNTNIFQEWAYAAQLSREVTAPGRAGLRPENAAIDGIYRSFGMRSMEDVRQASMDLIHYGLDQGGELAYALKEYSEPLLEAAGGGKVRKATGTLVKKFMDFYRRPDVMAKIIAYRSNLSELMRKRGVDVPTDDIKAEAVRRAKMTTQNPETTPAIVRKISSKGVSGAFFGAFQGFAYQMHRNIVLSMKLGLEDIVTASKLAAEATMTGDTKMMKSAAIHLEYGVDRVATTTMMSLYATDKVMDMLSEHQDKEKNLRYVMYPDRRNSHFLVQNVENVNGKLFVDYVDVGSVDVYNNTYRVLAAIGSIPTIEEIAANPGIVAQKLGAAAKEIQVQMLSPGLLYAAGMDLVGLEPKESPFKFHKRGSIEKEHTIVPGTDITAEGAYKAARRLGGGLARLAVDAGLAVTGSANPDLVDPQIDKLQSSVTRQITGFRPVRSEFNLMWTRRMNEDWRNKAAWYDKAVAQLKEAKTFESRRAIVKQYEKDWDKTYRSLVDGAGVARDMGMTNLMMFNTLNSKDYRSAIPKDIRQSVILGRPVSFMEYASRIK